MNGRFHGTLALALLCVAVAAPCASAATELKDSSPLVKSCQACHGARGDSRKIDIPRLNGQKGEYILTRIRGFLDPSRNTPHPSPITPNAAISNDDAAALAQYFSRQTPTPRIGFGIQSDAGAEIFLHGAEPAIPVCATCHGLFGDGLGETPRIAGQKDRYLMQQLEAFKAARRVGIAMNRHTWDMTLEQMQELSAYLSD